MGDMATYLDELDVKATDYAVRVQIACAQAIIEAIHEQPRFTHWSGAATQPDNTECPDCKGAGYYGLNDDTVVCKCRAASDATAAWEAHKKAYEIVRAEMDDLHRTLTQCGVPEQIPPFKAALAPAKARALYLSTRCNQLFDETTDAQERLDQFEAYAITVKSALDDRDRVRVLEAALRFYADPQTYGLNCGNARRIYNDAGAKARAALAGGGE